VTFGFGFIEPTPEQRAMIDAARARSEDLMNRFKRLLAEELDPEQLEVLHHVLSHIANTRDAPAASIANWYEGMVLASLFVRDIRLDEATENPLLLQIGNPTEFLVPTAEDVDEDPDDDLPPDPFPDS
jgi:hypothetical protein